MKYFTQSPTMEIKNRIKKIIIIHFIDYLLTWNRIENRAEQIETK